MSTRRTVEVPDTAETIGQTNRFLKLPFAAPRTEQHHAANARELERVINRIPLGSGKYDYGFSTNLGLIVANTSPVLHGTEWYEVANLSGHYFGDADAMFQMYANVDNIPIILAGQPLGAMRWWVYLESCDATLGKIEFGSLISGSVYPAGELRITDSRLSEPMGSCVFDQMFSIPWTSSLVCRETDTTGTVVSGAGSALDFTCSGGYGFIGPLIL